MHKPHLRIRLLMACMMLIAPVMAPADSSSTQAIRQEAQAWVTSQVKQAYPDAVPRVEMGQVDSRLQLGGCQTLRFFLPAGARLWAGGSVGLKCTAPSQWTIYLTYRVQLTGPALSALNPLPARHLLGPADVALTQVTYEQDPGGYLSEIPPGATTRGPINAGKPLIVHDLNLPDIIQAGAKVLVKVEGKGFNVTQEGNALNSAKVGGSVKVKMPNGRIVRGLANRNGEVEIRP